MGHQFNAGRLSGVFFHRFGCKMACCGGAIFAAISVYAVFAAPVRINWYFNSTSEIQIIISTREMYRHAV